MSLILIYPNKASILSQSLTAIIKMLKREEKERYYTTTYNSVKWYKITSRISKRFMEIPWLIIEIRIDTNNNTLYDYHISSHYTLENAKKLAESIILYFDPQLIPTIKNDKPKIRYSRFWILIEDKKNNYDENRYIRLDGKRNSFIRCYTNYEYVGYLTVKIIKKIKLEKVDEKTHIALWLKEWNNYNAYMPEFWNIYSICKSLKEKKDKLYKKNKFWLWNIEAENFINWAINKYVEELILSVISIFTKKEYSYTIVWKKELPNKPPNNKLPKK